MTESDLKYINYKIGIIIEVEEMKAPLKKCKVQIAPNSDETL